MHKQAVIVDVLYVESKLPLEMVKQVVELAIERGESKSTELISKEKNHA